MMEPYIWSESGIDGNGLQMISVMTKDPIINDLEVYQGGKHYTFFVDHTKQKTAVYEATFNSNGGPKITSGCLKVWKDEILIASECLEWATKYQN